MLSLEKQMCVCVCLEERAATVILSHSFQVNQNRNSIYNYRFRQFHWSHTYTCTDKKHTQSVEMNELKDNVRRSSAVK